MNTYLACSAVLVILYFLLAFNVSLTRRKTRTGIGSGPDPSGLLNRAVRAHGNAAEYIPIFVLLFVYFNSVGAAGWITWVTIAVTVCRVLHPIAIFMSPDLNKAYPLRFIGSLGTYLGGLALGVALAMHAAT
ncbi:MAG: MAPEG family protein [Steroidobacteraceae bacterium]